MELTRKKTEKLTTKHDPAKKDEDIYIPKFDEWQAGKSTAEPSLPRARRATISGAKDTKTLPEIITDTSTITRKKSVLVPKIAEHEALESPKISDDVPNDAVRRKPTNLGLKIPDAVARKKSVSGPKTAGIIDNITPADYVQYIRNTKEAGVKAMNMQEFLDYVNTHGSKPVVAALASPVKIENTAEKQEVSATTVLLQDENQQASISITAKIQYKGLDKLEIRRKWKCIFYASLMWYRVMSLQKLVNLKYSHQVAKLLTTKPKPLKYKQLLDFSKLRVKSAEQIEQVLATLSRISRSFRLYSYEEKKAFCEILQFQVYPAVIIILSQGSLLVKDGHKARGFYVVLSGHLEGFVIRGSERKQSENAQGFAGDIAQNNLAELLRIPLFSSAYAEEHVDLDSLINACQFQSFDANEIIISEDDAQSHVYFVLDGICKTEKMLLFLQKEGQKAPSPLLFHPQVLNEAEHVITANINIHTLTQGNHFPALGMPVAESDLSSNKLHFIENAIALGKENYPFTLIAESKCKVVMLSIFEFASHLTNSMSYSLQKQSLATVALSRLHDAYFDQKRWNEYKKDVVDSLFKK